MFPFTSQRPINTAAQWGTAVGGGLRAVGVGGGVTGFGADLIVIDDPVKNRAQAESETYRDRVWEWYNDDLYTRLEPNGSLVLIQTRWHEDDLAGRLIKRMNEGGDQWEIVDLPALAIGPDLDGLTVGPDLAGSEPGGIATGLPRDLSRQAKDTQPSLIATDRKVSSPFFPASDERDGANHPSALSVVELEDEPQVVKPRIIGFPRLYSHVNDATTKSYPHYKEGVVAASADWVVLSSGNETTSHLHAVGTARSEQGARSPVTVGDWRRPGDALCPERYPEKELVDIRSHLGTYSFSALYQQQPTPADGAMFKRQWLRNIVEAAPPGLKWYRGYDLAISTKTTADYTASFRVAVDDLGVLYIADGFRERIEYPEQRRFIIERLRSERDTRHGVEDSVHGKAIIQDLRRDRRLMNFAFKAVPVVGDKLTRALKWSPIAEEGKLRLVRGAWIDKFVNELIRFPMGKHDDQTDAVSIAVHMMAEMPDRRLHRF